MLGRFTVPIHDERKQFLANKMYYAHAQFAHVEDTEAANVLVALLYLKIGVVVHHVGLQLLQHVLHGGGRRSAVAVCCLCKFQNVKMQESSLMQLQKL